MPISFNSATRRFRRTSCLAVLGYLPDWSSDWVSKVTYRRKRAAAVDVKPSPMVRGYCITMRFSSRRSAMRAILSVLVALIVAGPGATALLAQSDQAPVFRSGVEVMEVDVTVVDAKGMPVRDLRAPEFTVTVDGQPRRVISAEFISDTSTPSGEPARPRDPYVSNNTDRRPGRLIMLVIDRNNIDTQTIRGATAALKRFVTSISPQDRLSLVTIPPPGPYVDFTTNHAL